MISETSFSQRGRNHIPRPFSFLSDHIHLILGQGDAPHLFTPGGLHMQFGIEILLIEDDILLRLL